MVRKKIEGFIIVTQRGDGVEGQGGRVGGRRRVGAAREKCLSEGSMPDRGLRKNRSSPSAKGFAECNLSGTRQTIYLPSAKEKTLGKKKDTRQTRLFAKCQGVCTRQTAHS